MLRFIDPQNAGPDEPVLVSFVELDDAGVEQVLDAVQFPTRRKAEEFLRRCERRDEWQAYRELRGREKR